MMYLPEKDYDLPNLDLLTLIFDSPLAHSEEDTVLHVDATLPSSRLTKAQTRTITKRLIYTFRKQFGIGQHGPGKDIVVCMSSGQILAAAVFYGVIGAGGVYSAASYSFTVPELVRQIKQGGANLLVISEDCKEVGLKAAEQCGMQPGRVLILQSMGGLRSLVDATDGGRNYLEETRELDWSRITDRDSLEKSLICLLYSSGTTGPPKGVCLSHWNLVQEAVIPTMNERTHLAQLRRKDPSFNFETRTIAHLPAAHIAGVQGYFINAAIASGPVHWMPKFDFLKFLEYNKKYKITTFFTVPPIFLLIAKSPLVTDQFQSLQQCISGAAPLGAELQALAEKRLGTVITQTWGLSETTGSITRATWDQGDPTGGISPLLPNTRMRIVDDNDQDVEEGQEGELLVTGPQVMRGYYKNEKATREAFTSDGWFKTGDIGLRRDGRFYIVDRKKELIKYKGLQVAPAELEALLLSHDLILDAAVIGVPAPDGSGNELPRAYVVADKSKISEQEIKDFVKSNSAQHKQLRGGVVWLDVIPKSASGKILRRELRELAKKEETSQPRAKL